MIRYTFLGTLLFFALVIQSLASPIDGEDMEIERQIRENIDLLSEKELDFPSYFGDEDDLATIRTKKIAIKGGRKIKRSGGKKIAIKGGRKIKRSGGKKIAIKHRTIVMKPKKKVAIKGGKKVKKNKRKKIAIKGGRKVKRNNRKKIAIKGGRKVKRNNRKKIAIKKH